MDSVIVTGCTLYHSGSRNVFYAACSHMLTWKAGYLTLAHTEHITLILALIGKGVCNLNYFWK